MNSAHMGDVMAQIGVYEWLVNMVRTAQANRTGADVNEEKDRMKIGSYESVCFQHNTMPLCFAMWADNNIVKTLSNYHSPTILPEGPGVMRKKKGADGKREFRQSPVPCPQQSKDYSETFHLIDKGNGAEAKFDMGGHSRTHNWCPKLVWRLFNMSQNNAYQIYTTLVEKHTKGRRFLEMREAVQEMTHSFCQRGAPMRSQKAEHPAHVRDLTNVFDSTHRKEASVGCKGIGGWKWEAAQSGYPKAVPPIKSTEESALAYAPKPGIPSEGYMLLEGMPGHKGE